MKKTIIKIEIDGILSESLMKVASDSTCILADLVAVAKDDDVLTRILNAEVASVQYDSPAVRMHGVGAGPIAKVILDSELKINLKC